MSNNQVASENVQVYYIYHGNSINGVFKKTPKLPPIATVTLLWVGDKMSRGVAIYSMDEGFSRKGGRKRTLSRARRAMYTEQSGLPLGLENSSWDGQPQSVEELEEALIRAEGHYGVNDNFKYLSEFNPELTDYELKLLEIHKEKEALKLANSSSEMLATEAILNMSCVPV